MVVSFQCLLWAVVVTTGKGFLLSPLAPNVLGRTNPHSSAADAESKDDPSLAVSFINPLNDETTIYLIPAVTTVIAFNFYEFTSKTFHSSVEALSQNTWIPVDGGTLLADIITPALNGPVMTSISILLGTLTAITISSLYSRQNQILQTIITELEELRNLAILMRSFPPEHRITAFSYLSDFVDQFSSDVRMGKITPSSIRSRNMDRLVMQLNVMSSESMTGSDTAISDNILGGCYASVSRISSYQCTLISSIQGTFPALHYTTLSALAGLICIAFLVETDRNVLLFLAAFQLKVLWAALLGVFSLLGVVIQDLNTPFEGTYSVIERSTEDLYRVKALIDESIQLNE